MTTSTLSAASLTVSFTVVRDGVPVELTVGAFLARDGVVESIVAFDEAGEEVALDVFEDEQVTNKVLALDLY